MQAHTTNVAMLHNIGCVCFTTLVVCACTNVRTSKALEIFLACTLTQRFTFMHAVSLHNVRAVGAMTTSWVRDQHSTSYAVSLHNGYSNQFYDATNFILKTSNLLYNRGHACGENGWNVAK